jgi:hypothetical protein
MEIFFGFCKKKLAIFGLCKKFSAPGQNQRDERDYSAFGRGCVMRDCRIERNVTVFTAVRVATTTTAPRNVRKWPPLTGLETTGKENGSGDDENGPKRRRTRRLGHR